MLEAGVIGSVANSVDVTLSQAGLVPATAHSLTPVKYSL